MIQLKVRILPSFVCVETLNLTVVQLQTMLNCIDNSGAAVVECVAVMRKKTSAANIGIYWPRDLDGSS